MTDLHEYAKREAEYAYEVRITSDTTDGYRALAYRDGILDTFEQLQRDDVIEAGAKAWIDMAWQADGKWERFSDSLRNDFMRHARVFVAAALARIAEGGEQS